MKKILVISDASKTINLFEQDLASHFEVYASAHINEAFLKFGSKLFDYLFIDLINIKGFRNSELKKSLFAENISLLQEKYPTAKKIIMAERHFTQDCILALKLGVDNYINYPLVIEEVEHIINLEYEAAKKDAILQHFETKTLDFVQKYKLDSKSKVMREVFEQVQSVADTKTTVLITGESGTGKSVLAKIIHDLSNRAGKKFINVHCGAISDSLIESELFGHEKGAFTGAIKRKLGKFELANHGTLFLDEIGTMSKATQVNLLQAIQERFIQRVGGEENISVDVRIIAATNIDLGQSVIDNSFREDLYYRLNVFPIEIPPLRERREDLMDLSQKILAKLNHAYGKNIDSLHAEVQRAFLTYSWPGNIRELENLIERAYVLEKAHILTPDSFPFAIFQDNKTPKVLVNLYPSLNLNEARRYTLDSFERSYLIELFQASKGSLKEASKLSGVTVRQLHKFMAKHQMSSKEFSALPFSNKTTPQSILQVHN